MRTSRADCDGRESALTRPSTSGAQGRRPAELAARRSGSRISNSDLRCCFCATRAAPLAMFLARKITVPTFDEARLRARSGVARLSGDFFDASRGTPG